MKCTQTYRQEVAVSSTLPPYPSPRSSLSQMYFIINQLVAHLLALLLVFFYINKALIAFSLEHDLARCVPSCWEFWPWRTRLDYFTFQLGPQAVFKLEPSAKRPATVTLPQNTKENLQDKGRHKQTSNIHTHTHTHTHYPGQWLKNTKYISRACGRGKTLNWAGNQAGKLISKDKSALRLHHKQGNYGVFQNRGQAI